MPMYADRGIMCDNTTLKIPGFRIGSKTRSVLLIGTTGTVVGLLGYMGYRAIKSKNEIKMIYAKADADYQLYKGRKEIDRQYGRPTSTDSEVDSCAPESEELTESSVVVQSFAEDVRKAKNNGAPVELLPGVYDTDRVVIFGGPGSGKSAAAAQIGFKVCTGKPCGLFPDEQKSVPQRVLLIDAEQEEEDLFQRYGNIDGEIPSNFTRISNCHFDTPEEVVSTIRNEVSTWTENGTVIIDNITSLFSLQSAEKIRKFYSHLRGVQKLQNKRGLKLSYIILCHESKSATKLDVKAMQGSGNIGNFATKVFAIGESTLGGNMRYLKVLKSRRNPKPGNVYLMELVIDPYLHFEYRGEVSEDEATGRAKSHQKEPNQPVINLSGERKLTDEQIQEIKELHAQGRSVNSIAQQFHVNRGTIKKYLKR